MQHHQVLAVEAKQHARRPFRRQVRPDFPEAVSHRAAHRHAYRPAPLRPQQVLPYPLTLGLIQPFQPLPHGFTARPRAVEDQRVFCGFGSSAILHLSMYSEPYNVHICKLRWLRTVMVGLEK